MTFTYNSRGQALTAVPIHQVVYLPIHTTQMPHWPQAPIIQATQQHTRMTASNVWLQLLMPILQHAHLRTITTTTRLRPQTNGAIPQHLRMITNDNLTAITDRLGNTTTFAYDGMDRVASVTGPLGNASQTIPMMKWRGQRHLPTRNGNTTTLDYDTRGRLVSITDGASKIWASTYDAESIIASTLPTRSFKYRQRFVRLTRWDV